ncbi:hypothetical protein RFI_38599 [Reticulomyxa filosa]|uniref:Uncharacterized protein n=1 Tax=Reticulomyxa filosa TaxID=46433 RepID=X6LBJ9_RETFI|nr:hypothetical protein RFI_38599 [Reticulomyxa filosa]|eukprot:ETN98888.1 hypothetical protein RFI_38599 [Reticulomyxa filosa]
MWNHQIDANLIHAALNLRSGNIDKTIELLLEFEQWKLRDSNEQNYKKKMNEFLEKRCCDHNINLFLMFCVKNKTANAIKWSTTITVNIGLPFVKKNKKYL